MIPFICSYMTEGAAVLIIELRAKKITSVKSDIALFLPWFNNGIFQFFCLLLQRVKPQEKKCWLFCYSGFSWSTVVLGFRTAEYVLEEKKNKRPACGHSSHAHCWVCMISYHFFPLAFPMKPMHWWGGHTVVCDETQQTPQSVFELAALPRLASWHIYAVYFWFGKAGELIERQPCHDTALDLQTLYVHVRAPVVSI